MELIAKRLTVVTILCCVFSSSAYADSLLGVLQDIAKNVEKKHSNSGAYDREDWQHWLDLDGDCMNTRHELLLSTTARRDLRVSKNGCYVSKGKWYDPYSGKYFYNPRSLEVDHVVPLYWAHSHGGQNWSKRKKARFANDTDNLLIVHGLLNQQKKAKGLDRWLPPNKEFECSYTKVWKKVLEKYPSLMLKRNERKAFLEKYTRCGLLRS